MTSPFAFWRKHFLRLELGLAVALTAAAFAWFQWFGGRDVLDTTFDGNRAPVYGALAGIFGSLLGFVITAASIVLGFSGSERLTVIRESDHYPTLWRVFVSATRSLAFATVVAITALILDRDKRPCRTIMFVMAFAAILAALRLARCVWALENVIALVARPSNKSA